MDEEKTFKVIYYFSDFDYKYQIRKYKNCTTYELWWKGKNEADDKYYFENNNQTLANQIGMLKRQNDDLFNMLEVLKGEFKKLQKEVISLKENKK